MRRLPYIDIPYLAGGVAQDVKELIIMIGEPLSEITR